MRKLSGVLLFLLIILPALHAQVSTPVHFSNNDTIRFGGTLTMPAIKGKVPAVVLLSGTGKQDRDGTMAGHKMFKALADSLAAAGIAVLRTDDRGTGETNGTYEEATTADFANDALAAVAFLRKQPRIGKIGLIGHSEGGAAAIIAAAQAPQQVDFVITLAGLATRGIDALMYQNMALIEAAPISDYDKNRHRTINTRMFDTAYCYAYTPQMEAKLRATYNQWKHADDSAYAVDKPGIADHMRYFADSYIRQATGRWYQYHIRYDPVPLLQKIKVPFLALNGDKDIMVPYAPNFKVIMESLAAAGNKQVQTIVLPGLNHLLLHCNTCTNDELPRLPGDIDQSVITAIRRFIKSTIR
ncbi:S9 family peptidase [Chitinophaga sp. Cy-1792]|uniref:alpha/beta hydrolase family protein n=1 Tax=Chitinophaga sp. Cy-1792 TaxID=2608339 RepID=UPI00141F3F4F|nr:alpha/beta hydrolase [Chitinophaga sp. Cy-1792]NIG55115.1 alpha/beta hydrolase [Chitinophaga sp. Cy-1792]